MKKIREAMKYAILRQYGWKMFGYPEVHLIRAHYTVTPNAKVGLGHRGLQNKFSFSEAWNAEFGNSFWKWFLLDPDRMLPISFCVVLDILLAIFGKGLFDLPLWYPVVVLFLLNFGLVRITIEALIDWHKMHKKVDSGVYQPNDKVNTLNPPPATEKGTKND